MPMPGLSHRPLLLLPLLWLAGCATVPTEPPQPDALTQAIQSADCRGAFELGETGQLTAPGQFVTVSQLCLQTGDFARARRAAGDFLAANPDHPDADYAAYLHALAGFGAWNRAQMTDPETRISEGRALFRELTAYMRERPLSEYGDDLAPRLVRLREGIAGSELALAQRERRRGNPDEARARAEYVLHYYPRTQAAADAAHLLMALDGQ
jgi:outer membrane protein assembly factor BamD